MCPTSSVFLRRVRQIRLCLLFGSLKITGDLSLVSASIKAGTCTMVIGKSYTKDLYPDVCVVIFILKCSEERGVTIKSFGKKLMMTCTYRVELQGLRSQMLLDNPQSHCDWPCCVCDGSYKHMYW